MSKKKTKRQSPSLKVYLFNVGQGENILLELPNGEYGIIDFYYENELGEPPALTYLKYLKEVEKKSVVISFVCLSHPDLDHITGVNHFLDWVKRGDIKVRSFWLFAGSDFDDLVAGLREAYEDYVARLADEVSPETEKIKWRIDEIKDRVKDIRDFLKAWKGRPEYLQDIRLLTKIDRNTVVCNLAPLGHHIKSFQQKVRADFCRMILEGTKNTRAPRNLMSSIINIKFRSHNLLFGGDTGLDIWIACLNQLAGLKLKGDCQFKRANFVKASHHGSKNSSSEKLWERILHTKTFIGISAGKRYGHPNRETLEHIEKAARHRKTAVKVFSTNAGKECNCDPTVKEVQVNWFSQRPYKVDSEIRQGLSLSKAKGKQAGIAVAPDFVGYIFEFKAANRRVQVTQAVTRPRPLRTLCLYQDLKRRGFHQCAL